MADIERGKLYYMQEFRKNLVQFLDELIEQFPEETKFVMIRIAIQNQVPVADVIGRFIRDILPFREEARQRNDRFFIDHPFLYMSEKDMENIGKEKIDQFTKLWRSDRLDDKDRSIIWDWLDIFMEYAHKYYTQYGYVKGWEKK